MCCMFDYHLSLNNLKAFLFFHFFPKFASILLIYQYVVAHSCDIVSAMFEIDLSSAIFILNILVLFHNRCFITIISTYIISISNSYSTFIWKESFLGFGSQNKRISKFRSMLNQYDLPIAYLFDIVLSGVKQTSFTTCQLFLGIYRVNRHQTKLLFILMQALIRKWAPVAIVLGVVMFLFWVKNKIW